MDDFTWYLPTHLLQLTPEVRARVARLGALPIVCESDVEPPPGWVEIQRDDEWSRDGAGDEDAAAAVAPDMWRYYSPVIGFCPTARYPEYQTTWWNRLRTARDTRTRVIVPVDCAKAAGLDVPDGMDLWELVDAVMAQLEDCSKRMAFEILEAVAGELDIGCLVEPDGGLDG